MKLDDVLKGSYQRYIAADFLSTVFFNKRIPLVIDGVEKSNANDIKQKLLDVYGDIELTVEKDGEDKCVLTSQISGDEDVIIAPSVALVDCKRFDFSDLEQIMHRLRADDGCEWDRAQTHESIRINLIEEAYELVDAIDRKDADDMKEECGDVLMQAVFHAEIAQKEGDFGYMDMITGLCRKLIDRHTHISEATTQTMPTRLSCSGKRQKRKKNTINPRPTKWKEYRRISRHCFMPRRYKNTQRKRDSIGTT